MSREIREALGDADRWHTRDFLQSAIGNEVIEPILSRGGEDIHDRRSDVLHIVDAEGIAAAAHFGPPYAEADEFTTNGGPAATSTRLLEQTRMLHSIAVRRDRRRSGLGRNLLEDIERRAVAAEAFIIFGVATGPVDADGFYLDQGFSISPAETALALRLGGHHMVFPLANTEARWFVKIIAQPPQRRRRLFRKLDQVWADASFLSPEGLAQLRAAI